MMNIIKAEQMLLGPRELAQLIVAKRRVVNKLQDEYDCGCGTDDKVEEILRKKHSEINYLERCMQEARSVVYDIVDRMERPQYAELIMAYYLSLDSWETVAHRLGRSIARTYQIRKAMLQEVASVLDEEEFL